MGGRIKTVCQRIEQQPVRYIPVSLGLFIYYSFQKQVPKIQVYNVHLIDHAWVCTPCHNQDTELSVSPSAATQQQPFMRTIKNNCKIQETLSKDLVSPSSVHQSWKEKN